MEINSKPVLALHQVTKQFKQSASVTTVLDQVDFKLYAGDFTVILGGNGAGKSTFLRVISGDLPVDKGTIEIKGEDVTQLPEEKRALSIARVFQDPMLGTAPRLTIRQNLALAYRRGQKRTLRSAFKKQETQVYQKALASLELGLEDRLDAEVGLLSGGQRQSLALVMATLRRPDLLLLDEHTAALDPKTQQKVMTLTNRYIKESGLTALMITHHLKDALTYGNRLIILEQGRIKADFNQAEKDQLTLDQLYHLLD